MTTVVEQKSDPSRRPAKVVYPVEYSRQVQDLDNWDHFFFLRVFGQLTMHEFTTPPHRVLDLGCGTGLWVMDAAKHWQRSTFVGFDINKIQPDLFRCGHIDLATRIQWVHGNFLEELPFPSEYFDFVRIHLIGLGVSEDRWQFLLEEVSRIMTSGAHLELMEEDLIFPCGPIPCSSTSLPFLPKKSLSAMDLNSLSSRSDVSSPETESPVSPAQDNLLIRKTRSQQSLDLQTAGSPRTSIDFAFNPRDHRRIMASWKGMLHNRFLAPQVVSVLPFYLSSIFSNVQLEPLIQVRLPQNSNLVHKEMNDRRSSFEHHSDVSFNTPPLCVPTAKAKKNVFQCNVLPNSMAPLQLARKLNIIIACKEPIWREYEVLFGKAPTVSQVLGRNTSTARDEFEFYWSNWVSDMTDRIGIRTVFSTALSWPVPPSDDPPSKPWRTKCGIIYAEETDDSEAKLKESDLCRSLRCFLAWKA